MEICDAYRLCKGGAFSPMVLGHTLGHTLTQSTRSSVSRTMSVAGRNSRTSFSHLSGSSAMRCTPRQRSSKGSSSAVGHTSWTQHRSPCSRSSLRVYPSPSPNPSPHPNLHPHPNARPLTLRVLSWRALGACVACHEAGLAAKL